MLQNKTILITGGTGSFGSTLAKLLVYHNPKEIRILSRDIEKQQSLKLVIDQLLEKKDSKEIFSKTQIKLLTGDITDKSVVNEAVKGCDFIFHAAALKDVLYCEQHPLEALSVNVYGTNNIIESAVDHKVQKVVVVSTDKAVAPAGTMGITKAMMERVVLSKSSEIENHKLEDPKTDHQATSFVIIRFGNLMGSSGTVVPLFIKQVKEGKKLTVTNPKMTRFMMTLSQAAEYALFALEKGNNGDIIIRNSPALSIGNLARAVIELYGINVKNGEFDSTSQIIVTGSRPGERLFEIMASDQEMIKSDLVNDSIYLRIPLLTKNINFSNSEKKTQVSELNSSNIGELDVEAIKVLIKN
ncbi:MAG: UDP-glucose 4-epimerase [Bacteroidetes bacterium HGW-Bacteroidetes-7]|jgi:UDP-glucose 4-epimerase|nr:MAG: UDP-glucose 4-epimerase [Bacteroidetes bacterium HGW-Bacteroidetes-7]